MKKFCIFICVFILQVSVMAENNAGSYTSHPATDVNDEWRLGMQLWTFHKYTFFDALEKTAALGISWIEAYPGQKLGKEYADRQFHHTMSDEDRQLVKNYLKSHGLRLVNYGVVGLPNDEQECRQVFDFARDMGIETLVSEPPDDAWDIIDRLCQEYQINVAIHNHPTPSHYWNPDKVLEVSEGRSDYVGVCADIGHWMRSGIQPIDALKKLEGKIKSLHFGDLNQFGVKEAHDVPWGTGVADLKSIMKELIRQDFKGVFSIEYEYNWEASVPEVRQSIAFFDQAVSEIKTPQWFSLLDDDLSQWTFETGSWEISEGELTAKAGGDIWTKDRYADFILDLEFKLDEKTNSGVFLRTGSIEEWLHTAIEVQILDSYGNSPVTKHDCGGIFDCLEPKKNMVRKPGEWNRYTITCKQNKIYVVLNGEQVIDMDLDRWEKAHINPDGTDNKFSTAYKDMPREGHIGLQYHGHPVWFRNVKLSKI